MSASSDYRYHEWVFERDGEFWIFGQKRNYGPFATADEANYNLSCIKGAVMEEVQQSVVSEPVSEGVAEVVEAEKPKRKRRTKAEMEAARGAQPAGSEPTAALVKAPAVEERVSGYEAKARDMLEAISVWEIQSQEHMDLAGKIEAQAVAERKKLEAELKEITDPIRAAEKKVRDLFKPAIGYCKATEEALKLKVKQFRLAAAAAQDAALKAIAESGGVADASTLMVAHGAEVLALPENLREKVYFTWKCTDFAKVPESLKRYVLDEAMITAVVDRDGLQAQIPGIEITREVDIHNKAVRK